MDATAADSFVQLVGDAWRLMRRMPREWWALFVVMGFLGLLSMVPLIRGVRALVSLIAFVIQVRMVLAGSRMLADGLRDRTVDWREAMRWSSPVLYRSLGFVFKVLVLYYPLLVVMGALYKLRWEPPIGTLQTWMTVVSAILAFLVGWRFATSFDHYLLNRLGFRASLRRAYRDSGRHLRLFAWVACTFVVPNLIELVASLRADVQGGAATSTQAWYPVLILFARIVAYGLMPFMVTLFLLQWLRYGEGASLAAFDRPMPSSRRYVSPVTPRFHRG